jgi:hypothetical protein
MPYPFGLAYLLMEPSGSKKITRHPLVLYSESTDFYPEAPEFPVNSAPSP